MHGIVVPMNEWRVAKSMEPLGKWQCVGFAKTGVVNPMHARHPTIQWHGILYWNDNCNRDAKCIIPVPFPRGAFDSTEAAVPSVFPS